MNYRKIKNNEYRFQYKSQDEKPWGMSEMPSSPIVGSGLNWKILRNGHNDNKFNASIDLKPKAPRFSSSGINNDSKSY